MKFTSTERNMSISLLSKRKNTSCWEFFFSIIVLSLIGLFEGQFSFFVLLCFFVLMGLIFIKYVLRFKYKESFDTYFIFIGIYGLLALLSHIELIYGRDPTDSYYIHNDAAWSFYAKAVQYCLAIDWKDIVNDTIFNLYFADYPLAAFIFAIVSKLGQAFDVVDLRLLLRCHVFVFAAVTTAMITNIQIIRSVIPTKAKRQAILFGTISYLFITSCIFSRDLHVCFGYTLIAYLILLPHCRNRLIKLIIAGIITMGFRPVSGVLAFVFIFGFYATKNNFVKYLFIPIILLLGIVFLQGNAFVEEGLERVGMYGESAESQTGGIFGKIYSLPFPVNQLGMIVYMLLMPLPITKYIYVDGGGGTFLTLPFVLSPYLMSLLLIGVFWLLCNRKGVDRIVLYFMFLSIMVFAVTVFGSPDLRRSFATIPGLFMAYCLYWDKIPKKINLLCKTIIWPTIFFINIFFFVYLYGK